jgi:hypothetical protein
MKDKDLTSENREAYELCRDYGHSSFLNMAEQCDSYVRGEQWTEDASAEMKRRRKPLLTINKVLPVYAVLLGEEINRRGDVSFRPAAGGSQATAASLDKLWLHFSQTNNLTWKEALSFTDGVVRSRGFLDLRVDFDSATRGEPVLNYLNSKDVLLYPDDTGYDPDGWSGVILTKWMTASTIHELYGVPLEDVDVYGAPGSTQADYVDWKRDSFGNQHSGINTLPRDKAAKYKMLRVIERQDFEYVSSEVFIDPTTGEVRLVPESWDRERISETINQFGYQVSKKRMRKIRWTVSAGDLALHNKMSPYRHLTVVPYFPFLIGGKPLGVIQHLISPQDLLNKTLSQELHIVAGIANSGWKVKKNSLSNMSVAQLERRGGEDGIVIEVTSNLGDVEKLQPNTVPTGMDRLSYKAGEFMQQISLVSESMQGLDRADVSGDAIQMKAERGSLSLSPIYTSLDETRRILARNWLDLVQQYVTEERMYHITGKDKGAQTEQLAVNQPQEDGSFLNDLTVGEYGIVITDVKSRDAYDLEQFGYLIDMIRQGAPVPWSAAVKNLGFLENKDELVEQMKQREGLNPPGEQEKRRAELEERTMAAQAADKEASAAVKQAQAQKVVTEAGKEDTPDPSIMMKAQAEERKMELMLQMMMLKMEQMQEQAATERAKYAEEVRMTREQNALMMEKMRTEIQMLREKGANELYVARQKADFEDQRARQEAERDMEFAQQRQKQDMLDRAQKLQADLSDRKAKKAAPKP